MQQNTLDAPATTSLADFGLLILRIGVGAASEAGG